MNLGLLSTLCSVKPKVSFLLLSVFTLIAASFPQAQADTIKIGMSTALEGPAQGLGTNVKAGVESYFGKVNAAGGINGKPLQLVALNDGYEPDKAADNMQQLIEKESVFAVLGNVGTPTAVVTVPIANKMKTPLIGAITGAGLLRKDPPDRYVINYRASYAQETAAMIDGLLAQGIKPEEIAFFTQKDGYGDAGYSGGVNALKRNGFSNTDSLAHGRYQRNTTNVEEGLLTVLSADVEPRAIIMVGAYKPCAEFIKLAKEELPNALFLNVSFVGSIPLKQELGDQAEGIIVTQVVPHFNSSLNTVKEFRSDLQRYGNGVAPGFLSLEGYLAAKMLVMGIQNANSVSSPESIVDGLNSLNQFDMGIGVPLSLSEDKHQASDQVWPTRIKNGEYVVLDWSDI
ncbi:ABC transporter substrate-binding protein [Shewanella corallii]|uniref:ABC transporter substrate-binding protein n=1 Tax=Shewanella corallii TaxID=560080 RepID=A0ABT0N6Y1_9GAMM|nr:ABC transporter substrate-binding protein [Shewanella corallii]MCL2913895.1 ABC transporter substrate-binding protein [Shewanella corallii]